jgi:diguanylate cyclase (GGDEF)-like protein
LAIESDETVGLGANCLLVRRDGEEFAIEDTASPIHDVHDRVAGAVIVFHDVGVARALSLKMSHLAQHDPLTGLPNRVLLQDRLARAVATARREGTALAVLFIDVDRFKEINDTLGHTMGDHVLQSIAKRLRACTRESDTVSRRSGDEFVVLLPGVAASTDGALVAEKVLAAMSVPHRIEQHEVHATVSIGVAICPDHGADADTLLQRADIALADAKLRGRSTYRVYMPRMTPERAQSMGTDQTAGKAVRGYRLALLQLTDR